CVPLQAIAYRLTWDHLRVIISCADFQNEWPTPFPHRLTVHSGKECPSRIELPIREPRSAQPFYQLLPSDFPPLPPDEIPTPDYNVTRDLIKNAITVNIRTISGIGVNRSQFTVHVDHPADAVVKSEYEYPMERTGKSIRVQARCVTRSDAQA